MAAFRQVDIERIIRAAERQGALIDVDIRTLNLRIIPGANKQRDVDTIDNRSANPPAGTVARDGKENWDED